MKLTALIAITVGLGTCAALAQGGPRGMGGGRGSGRPPMMPLLAALDANTNGVIEANEIANAGAALLKLDKNGDGKLSADELQPQRPDGSNQHPAVPPGGRNRPAMPIMAALDANGDGELDAAEIANASAALLKLDANGDGQLTRDELMPRPPGGFGGPPPTGQ